MRLFTVDIGTNTILGLEADCAGDALVPRSDSIDIVRLGEGLDATGRLSDAAIERALAALAKLGSAIRERGIDRVGAVATEAVRKADNSDAFLARANAALGTPIEVIDGIREARLSWIATGRSIPAGTDRRVVVDIGGGSTELIVGSATSDEPDHAVSVPIGSVRLTERLLKGPPGSLPTDEEKRALVETVDRALQAAPRPRSDGAREPQDLVGIAGTVTSIAAMILQLTTYDAGRVHGARLSLTAVKELVARLGTMTLDEKRRLPGLDPRRADVIHAGGVILERVMAWCDVSQLIVSDRGIRWGLAYEMAERALGRRFH